MQEDLFDFDKIYAIYPRKSGKMLGLKRCRKTIKTQKDYDDLMKAVVRYRNETMNTSKQFIKMFDTFIGPADCPTWREYLDEDHESGSGFDWDSVFGT